MSQRSATGGCRSGAFGSDVKRSAWIAALSVLVWAWAAPALSSAQSSEEQGAGGAADGERQGPDEAAATGSSPFAWDGNIGFVAYQSSIKPGKWHPVWVSIRAKERDIVGDLIFRQENNPLLVQAPVRVAKGTQKIIRSYFKPGGRFPEIEAALRAKGVGAETMAIPFRLVDERDQHFLVLAEQSGGFSFLNRRAPDGAPGAQTSPLPEVCVMYGSVDMLPDDPIALEPLDAIVLNGPQVRAIRKEQWEAIETWTAMGGRLLIGAGRHQPFIQQSNLRSPFGIVLRDPEPLDLAGLFPARSGDDGPTVLASWPEPPEGGWDAVWIGDAQRPFLAGRRVGRGQVSVCAAALDPEVLAAINEGMSDAQRVWARALERHRSESPLQRTVDEREEAVSLALQMPFGFQLAGAWWVFGYLALYILVSLPLTWIVCGRLKRRAWAWPIAMLLALGFAAYGYVSGALSQVRDFVLNEVAFVNRPGPAGRARATTLSAVYSPRHFRTDFQADAKVFVAGSVPGMPRDFPGTRPGSDLYSNRPLTVSFGRSVAVRGFSIYPWSARNLRTDFTVEVAGGIEVRELVEKDQPTGRWKGVLVNRSPWSFSRWWLSDGVRWSAADGVRLDPGESVDLSALGAISAVVAFVGLRDALDRVFLKDRRQAEGDKKGRPDYLYDQWRGCFGQESPPELAQGPFFIGEVEGSLSPVAGALDVDQQTVRLFYEQGLVTTPTARGGIVDRSADRWQLVVDDAEARRVLTTQFGAGLDGVDGAFIPLDTADVQLVPDRAFMANASDRAEIRFRLEGYPPKEQRQGGRPMRSFFPVWVWNVQTGKWDSQGVWTGEGDMLANLSDYLHPATSAIAVRIDARLAMIVYSPKAGTEEEKKALEIGAEAVGRRDPVGTIQPGPMFILIRDLQVTLVPGNATTP